MVASGEIDEETAMGILQELASADAGAAGKAEAGEAAAEGAEAAMESPEFKQASALCAELISKVQK